MEPAEPDTADTPEIYDVLIIGAGPCGLATAARLREPRPSALFTDEEQRRYSWVQRNAQRASIKNKRNGKVKLGTGTTVDADRPSILVLDSSADQWMASWKRLFAVLEIEHLRSPMFFHPDPSDRDALLAYAHSKQRDVDLQEIVGCVGKETSKHQRKNKRRGKDPGLKPIVEINERDRQDYFAPSQRCFEEFCEACKERYHLDELLISQDTVQNICYEYFDDIDVSRKIFSVQAKNRRYRARFVVLATGAGEPIIPKPFDQQSREGAMHAMNVSEADLPSQEVRRKIKARQPTHVLIIGGGLTSAQLAEVLIRRGVTKVHLLMRRDWQIKPFDVDLIWMSKFRNQARAVFWSADSFEERLDLIKKARNGGSITSRYHKILQEHIRQGRLVVHTDTVVRTQSYSPESRQWTIETNPAAGCLPAFDFIYFATGSQVDASTNPMLVDLQDKYSVDIYGGLPALTADLQWTNDVPLYITGKMAGLQLGPSAGNLEGARLGAERVTWSIERLLEQERIKETRRDSAREDSDGAVAMDEFEDEKEEYSDRYAAGVGSKYNCLLDMADSGVV